MHENEISKIIFDLGLKIHKNLGPGLLESAYDNTSLKTSSRNLSKIKE